MILNILLWAWGPRWSWGWRRLRMSDNRKRWGLWWLRDPAACSQISGRSIDAAGRTQTRSPEPGNRAEAEQHKCQQKRSPKPRRSLTNRPTSHYCAAVIANFPSKMNPRRQQKLFLWQNVLMIPVTGGGVNPYLIIRERRTIRKLLSFIGEPFEPNSLSSLLVACG